jgi:hypothetical protein
VGRSQEYALKIKHTLSSFLTRAFNPVFSAVYVF